MNRVHPTLNFIARQYNEKWRFPDYDNAVKTMQCHHVYSFESGDPLSFTGVFQVYDVPVYICRFCPTKSYGNILAAANENGTVCIENIDRRMLKTYIQTHNNTVFDLAWMPGERQFVTASGDHSAKLWDCGESDVRLVSEFLGHTRSVKCVNFKPENSSVFATGSRDGSLIIWDSRCSIKCSRLPMSHIPDQIIPLAAFTYSYTSKRKCCANDPIQTNSVTGVLFQNDTTLLSCGSADRCIKVWDMRKTYARFSFSSIPIPKYRLFAPSTGFSHISIDPAGTKVYANCMDSYIYCFNINSYHPDPISSFYGHQNSSFYVKASVSQDGRYLLSGSSDRFAYIWNTRNAELSEVAIRPVISLSGHIAEVACAVMTPSGDMRIATCSDDGTYRVWLSENLTKAPLEDFDSTEGRIQLDYNCSVAVRRKWGNKRKLTINEAKAGEPKSCYTLRSKVRRYYSNSLSAFSCDCHRSKYEGSVKRPLTENERRDESQPEEKRSHLEETPTKSNGNLATVRDLESPPRTVSNGRGSLKRKLPDDSEGGCKRKAQERVLLPRNDAKGSGDEGGVSSEGQVDPLRKAVGDGNYDEDESNGTEFSSPTTNLPNYVKDGTSPYLHRCPKIQKENLDWLTKLRKTCRERSCGEDAESGSKAATAKGGGSDIKLSAVGAKRKLRIPSHEGKTTATATSTVTAANHTLDKYFKISSRAPDVGYVCQDLEKKAS